MIVVEAKYYPYLLMGVGGERHTEADYVAMFEATEAVARQAIRDKTRHVVVSSSNFNMSAAERKFVAARAAAVPQELQDVSLGAYVIAESLAIRGVLTALRWLTPSLVSVEAVGSVDAAMTATAAVFEAHGIKVNAERTRGARRWLEEQTVLQRKAAGAPG